VQGRLHLIAPGVYAWLQEPAGHGVANAGLVVDADGATLLDTLLTPAQAEPLAAVVEDWGLPLPRVVLTSSLAPCVGGTGRFWSAAFYGTEHTSAMMDLPPNVAGYRLLYPAFAAELPDELGTRPVSHTVTDRAWLTDAVELVPVAGPQPQNLVALAPGAGVCFAGAVASFGIVPLGFEADPLAWAAALDEVVATADVVVPGQGPLGTGRDAALLAEYLRACHDARGSVARLASGPWTAWDRQDLHEVNVERAAIVASGEDRVPQSMLRLVGLA
jgi:cyclase